MKKTVEIQTKLIPEIYGNDRETTGIQIARYDKLVKTFRDIFGAADMHLFSTPGRTELGGNHTDHNHGCVLAAAVNLDSIAAVSGHDDGKVILHSEGYDKPFAVSLNNLKMVRREIGTTTALIRGIAARFDELGYRIGGFCGYMTSDVLPGSGLSSSASVEVLIGTVFNQLFNNGSIPPETIAQIGQFAENEYFVKPCGLMDQMACSVGGIIGIDFKDPEKPVLEKISFDFNSQKYRLLIVNTGGSHSDLTGDYAAIPEEMKMAARICGGSTMRDVYINTFLKKIPAIRREAGDRAVLRGLHFLYENERVRHQLAALRKGDMNSFLRYVNDSGNASSKWLQNIFTVNNVREQGLSIALALTENFITEAGGSGACRIHGGGFAGTILAFIPGQYLGEYTTMMEQVFGKNSVQVLNIRSSGSSCLGEFTAG